MDLQEQKKRIQTAGKAKAARFEKTEDGRVIAVLTFKTERARGAYPQKIRGRQKPNTADKQARAQDKIIKKVERSIDTKWNTRRRIKDSK